MIAFAQLVTTPTGYRWKVRCPFCSRIHWHGGGPLAGDLYQLLGARTAECFRGDNELVTAEREAA
jgi:hypothetical protein